MTSAPSTLGTALVTGASSGIGAVYADRLAKRGYDLILVARAKDRLESLAERLRAETGRNVEVKPADLTQPSDLAAVEALLRTDTHITMLINNAGIAVGGSAVSADIGQIDQMIRLNVGALTRLAYAAAPGFAARAAGTIINIASVVALAPPKLVSGAYAATKAFALSLSQTLQEELADKGVRVQAVMPGATATEIWDRSGIALSNLPSGVVMSAEDVVDAALVGLDQGEAVTIPTLEEVSLWNSFDAARRTMSDKLFRRQPATRYRVRVAS